jgi:hypothetical protein
MSGQSFSGVDAIALRFSGVDAIALRFSGVDAIALRFSGVDAIALRFSGMDVAFMPSGSGEKAAAFLKFSEWMPSQRLHKSMHGDHHSSIILGQSPCEYRSTPKNMAVAVLTGFARRA